MGNSKLHLPVFSTGGDMEVTINTTLCDIRSDYQHIQIIDTKEFARCLVIDGLMQVAESDYDLYNQEMLRPLKPEDRKLLILGGGDGYIAIQAKKLFPKLEIIVVDIDKVVTDCCREYLHVNANDKARLNTVKFIHTDALEFLKNTKEKFDGVISDLTDTPVGASRTEEFVTFYKSLIGSISGKVSKNCWMGIQAGACEVSDHYIPTKIILKDLITEYFAKTDESCVFIPSYGEDWAFLFGHNLK